MTQVPRDEGQVIDLAVKLEPAPMRTIAGELGYGTGEGIRAEASWQHRNLFNPEGALTVRGVAGHAGAAGAVIFRRNNWLRRDQVLNAQALAGHVDRDAYEAKTLSLSAGFERQSNFIWQKKWTWSLGAELVATDEAGYDRGDRRAAAADLLHRRDCRAALGYDASDDLLDPTKGFRLLGRFSPEISFQGGAFPYARAADRRQRLSSGVGHGRRGRAGPAGHHPRRADATISRLRGASIPAAADRFAAMAISGSARATSTMTRSAGAAWPNSAWRRGSG